MPPKVRWEYSKSPSSFTSIHSTGTSLPQGVYVPVSADTYILIISTLSIGSSLSQPTHRTLISINFIECYAMMLGQVIKIGEDKRSGMYVTIRHGNYRISYCHLSQLLVKKKQWVTAGTPIAISGNSGRSTAPHLHLTFKGGHKTLNPQIFLDYIRLVRQEAIYKLKSVEQSSRR